MSIFDFNSLCAEIRGLLSLISFAFFICRGLLFRKIIRFNQIKLRNVMRRLPHKTSLSLDDSSSFKVLISTRHAKKIFFAVKSTSVVIGAVREMSTDRRLSKRMYARS